MSDDDARARTNNVLERFATTAEERARLETAPFPMTPDERMVVAGLLLHLMIKAHRDGDIPLKRALTVLRNGSIGCPPGQREFLYASMALDALEQPPKPRAGRAGVPMVLKQCAVVLIDWLREQHPGEPIVPNHRTHGSTPLLDKARAWLQMMGLIGPITPETLYYEWYVKTSKQMRRAQVDAASRR